MMKLAYCTATYSKDFEETRTCITRVSPYVDLTIVVYDQTLSEGQISWLTESDLCKENRVIPVKHIFQDNLPEMRNAYIIKAKELNVDWCVVSDPDELYSEELAKNLRQLIEMYDKEGYNRIAVPVMDQFDNIEWLDSLDRMKEVPGGYRETNYWKPLLIFKIYPALKYIGVGAEKNVHESLDGVPVKSINLDKKYYYIHKKSALKIWRNAARNMWIGGGGDNVGSKNPLWVRLRALMENINVKTWMDFEQFVTKGVSAYTQDPNTLAEFRQWLKDALKVGGTASETETRETAKFYLINHKEEADNTEISSLIKKVPELSKESEIEKMVVESYYKILGRHPDEEGKKVYVTKILNGELTLETFKTRLKNSEEYVEKIVIDGYINILGRAPDDEGKKAYVRTLREGRLSPERFYNILKNSDEYKQKFALKSFKTEIAGVTTEISSGHSMRIVGSRDTSRQGKVGLCIMGYSAGIGLINESIRTIGKEVDEIHIQGDDFTSEDLEVFKNLEKSVNKPINVHTVPWEDNFSDYKNKCMSWSNTEWVMISDHDEIPTMELAGKLREIIAASDRGSNYDMVSFDVIDVITINNEKISEHRNQGGKAILHWNIPNPYYGNPHIWLKPGYYPWRQVHMSVPYKHQKEKEDELPRSVRNVFMGGGGDSVKEGNKNWIELRTACNALGINTFKQFDTYLKKGKIDNNVLSAMKNLAAMPWKDNELKDVLRYYYLLHPDEEV